MVRNSGKIDCSLAVRSMTKGATQKSRTHQIVGIAADNLLTQTHKYHTFVHSNINVYGTYNNNRFSTPFECQILKTILRLDDINLMVQTCKSSCEIVLCTINSRAFSCCIY